MKYFLVLLIASILFVSCEDLQDNTPALQGTIDDVFFKANDARAVLNDNGSYTLQGYGQDKTLTLHINQAELGTYQLGEGQPNYASFEDELGNVYTTVPSGEGEIVLTDRCLSCGWLTGTFHFSGILQGLDTINVHRGIFYQVSFFEGIIGDGSGGISAGYLNAYVDNSQFVATTVSAELSGNTIVIVGAIDSRKITIEVPSNATSGNYNLPFEGYKAVYTNENGSEEAISGTITVNFNNTQGNHILIFFNFNTENNVITEGRTEVDY